MRGIRFRAHPVAIALLALALGGSLFLGCGSSSKKSATKSASTAKSSGGDTVQIKGFAFSPSTLNVKAGTKVTWTNNDSTDHTVTADKSDATTFQSGHLGNGKTFWFMFEKPGTYKYFCSIHNYMKASIVVS